MKKMKGKKAKEKRRECREKPLYASEMQILNKVTMGGRKNDRPC